MLAAAIMQSNSCCFHCCPLTCFFGCGNREDYDGQAREYEARIRELQLKLQSSIGRQASYGNISEEEGEAAQQVADKQPSASCSAHVPITAGSKAYSASALSPRHKAAASTSQNPQRAHAGSRSPSPPTAGRAAVLDRLKRTVPGAQGRAAEAQQVKRPGQRQGAATSQQPRQLGVPTRPLRARDVGTPAYDAPAASRRPNLGGILKHQRPGMQQQISSKKEGRSLIILAGTARARLDLNMGGQSAAQHPTGPQSREFAASPGPTSQPAEALQQSTRAEVCPLRQGDGRLGGPASPRASSQMRGQKPMDVQGPAPGLAPGWGHAGVVEQSGDTATQRHSQGQGQAYPQSPASLLSAQREVEAFPGFQGHRLVASQGPGLWSPQTLQQPGALASHEVGTSHSQGHPVEPVSPGRSHQSAWQPTASKQSHQPAARMMSSPEPTSDVHRLARTTLHEESSGRSSAEPGCSPRVSIESRRGISHGERNHQLEAGLASAQVPAGAPLHIIRAGASAEAGGRRAYAGSQGERQDHAEEEHLGGQAHNTEEEEEEDPYRKRTHASSNESARLWDGSDPEPIVLILPTAADRSKPGRWRPDVAVEKLHAVLSEPRTNVQPTSFRSSRGDGSIPDERPAMTGSPTFLASAGEPAEAAALRSSDPARREPQLTSSSYQGFSQEVARYPATLGLVCPCTCKFLHCNKLPEPSIQGEHMPCYRQRAVDALAAVAVQRRVWISYRASVQRQRALKVALQTLQGSQGARCLWRAFNEWHLLVLSCRCVPTVSTRVD